MTERKPIRFEIPPGAAVSPCRGCGQSVAWITTKAGKLMPVDDDGTSHFATCPKAGQFRKGR